MLIEGLEITRPSHACIKIATSSSKIIYIDPFQINSPEPADYVFITHEHYDHCSIADIRKIIKKDTVVVTVPDCQSKFTGLKFKELRLIKPGDSGKLEHLDYKAVPAYNLNKHFHLKAQQWVGFVLRIDGKLIYYTGDSDVIPEMRYLTGLDIIFVPVSGEFTMNSSEAAQLVNLIKPKYAVPMHYGAGVAGTQEDAEMFKKLVASSKVIVL